MNGIDFIPEGVAVNELGEISGQLFMLMQTKLFGYSNTSWITVEGHIQQAVRLNDRKAFDNLIDNEFGDGVVVGIEGTGHSLSRVVCPKTAVTDNTVLVFIDSHQSYAVLLSENMRQKTSPKETVIHLH